MRAKEKHNNYTKNDKEKGTGITKYTGQRKIDEGHSIERVWHSTSRVMLGCDWWLCMVINNVNVQYNGGFLPDIIMLTQGYYHWGTRLNTM